jgi:hypothetical protein
MRRRSAASSQNGPVLAVVRRGQVGSTIDPRPGRSVLQEQLDLAGVGGNPVDPATRRISVCRSPAGPAPAPAPEPGENEPDHGISHPRGFRTSGGGTSRAREGPVIFPGRPGPIQRLSVSFCSTVRVLCEYWRHPIGRVGLASHAATGDSPSSRSNHGPALRCARAPPSGQASPIHACSDPVHGIESSCRTGWDGPVSGNPPWLQAASLGVWLGRLRRGQDQREGPASPAPAPRKGRKLQPRSMPCHACQTRVASGSSAQTP